MKEDREVRIADETSKGLQRCNRNLTLEIVALFLALFGLICLVMGVYDLLISIVQIPGVTLPHNLSIAVAFFDFVPVILIGILCLALRAAVR
jgi:hypothetical protein